jgi:fibronectin-binding autotransporter adhesin
MKRKNSTEVCQVLSTRTNCLASVSRKITLLGTFAAGLATVILALNSRAADVSMLQGDGFNEHSFDSAGHWDSAAAPTSGNNYFSAFIVRSNPNQPNTNQVFQGDSLTLNPGGAIYQKISPLVMTINTLTNNGRVANAQGGAFTLLGNMHVTTAGMMDTGSGNSSGTDNRTITNGMTISGSGFLTNLTTDANWPSHSTAQGTVVFTGNNSAFTGPQIAMKNTVILVGSEANLGGNPSSFNPAQLVLDNGVLRPTASFSLNYPNGGITFGAGGGTFDIAPGISLTNAEALAGAGSLTLTNAGTLVHLGSAASYTGNLLVNGGTFILGAGGSLAGANTITIGSAATFDATATGLTLASGQTLAGNGTVTGTVTAGSGSKISPGGTGAAATLTVGTDLVLSGNATLPLDFLTTNDVIVVGGNLSPSGVTIVQPVNVPAVGSYPIITVAGTLGGSAANFHVNALTTRNRSYSIVYDTVSTPNRVLLQVSSAGSAANLVWQGDVINGVNNAWDIVTSSNWLNGVNTDVYYDADSVNFTDAGAANQPTLDVTVNPSAVNFNSSSDYTLTGAGGIAGLTAVSKGGTGTLTLSVTNTYFGGTVVTNGVLKLGIPQAVGSPSGATPLVSVAGTGTFDINGLAMDAAYTNVIQINGNGFSGTQGAIDNTVGGLTSGGGDIGIASLSLAGDSTVSATANWQIGNTGAGIVGNGHTLTKIGNNYLYLKHAAANPLGNFIIAGGTVLFWDHADAAGLTTPITLTNGASIDTWNPVTQFQGLTFANPIIVSDPVNGGEIMSTRTPYNHPDADIYNGSVVLNGPLHFLNNSFVGANQYNNNLNSYGKITMNGNIVGTAGVIVEGGTTHYVGSGSPEFYGGNLVTFAGNNSYSGPTLVSNLVQLLITTANQSGGSYDVVDYGTLDVAVAPGKSTIPMKSLTLELANLGAGNIGFTRLASMPASPVVYATNLTIISGVVLPPTAGYSIGQFPLIKYEGTIGGNGFAGLALGKLPTGVTASLIDNSANHTIDLQVTTAGVVWTGANSGDWDFGTVNWYNPVTASADVYSDGETVVFGDVATNFNVNVTQAIQPGGITVNSSSNYTFSSTIGSGNIGGSGALIKDGSGTLTISSTNNTFTGGTFINGGTVKLADQNFVYPYGGGALNNNLGLVSIANGGTLDINGVQVPNFSSFGPEGYNVFLSGAGVGGNGALINSSTNDNDLADPGYVTLTGDATVGGLGDINIRHGVSPQLKSQSSAYTLTKVGPGQFRLRYVTTVSTNFGPINILQGIVSYESSSALGLGDPTKSIMVGSGGGLAWGTIAAPCVRPMICSNNSAIYAYNNTSNVFNSLVTLVSGNVNLNANFYNGMTFSNVISGAGGLTLLAQTRVSLAATNTYSGNTVVVNCNGTNGTSLSGSILRLVGNGSINNSPNITLQGVATGQSFAGALDVSGRVDGTLTLVSGQTLRGDNGSYVRGNVIASSGATITPGGSANIQFMTVSNGLTLQAGSTVAMDVSLDSGITNDLIRVTGTTTYGGTLQLSNSGASVLTNGAAFKLFSNGAFSGNFATISGSPGTGLAWSFNPTNGTAKVVAVVSSAPRFTSIHVSGTTLSLTATNGVANGQYVLYSSTNLALPLAQWSAVLTNSFDANGNVNLSTNIVSPGIASQFYILK